MHEGKKQLDKRHLVEGREPIGFIHIITGANMQTSCMLSSLSKNIICSVKLFALSDLAVGAPFDHITDETIFGAVYIYLGGEIVQNTPSQVRCIVLYCIYFILVT